MKKKFYIIDVSNMFYRAFWGTEMLTTSYGMPVQGIHGFISMISALMRDHKPDYIALALESKTPTFRKGIDPLYKANRGEPAPELKAQLDMIPALLDALNYPTFQADGFEADDIIGTLAKSVTSRYNDIEAVIVSGDKDFCQLVNDKISVLDTMKNIKMGPAEVLAKYGIGPEQFIDYLGIVGDTADGFKGVEGIGPKGAVKLLQTYPTIGDIYSDINNMPTSTTKTKLIASQASAEVSKTLATINNYVPAAIRQLMAGLASIAYNGPKPDVLLSLLTKLEMKYHANYLLGIDLDDDSAMLMGKTKLAKGQDA